MSAITLAGTAPNTHYGHAVLVRSGGFTRADGSSGQARADGYGLIWVANAGLTGKPRPKRPPGPNSFGFFGHMCRIPARGGHGQLSNLECGRACGARLLRPSAVRGCVAGARPSALQLNEDYWDRRLSKLTGVRVSG